MVNAANDTGTEKDKDKRLALVIGTPKGTLSAKFEPSDTVGEVIAYVVEKKSLGGGSDAFELYLRAGDDKRLLSPADHTLKSFGVKSGDKMLLAATGSGV